MARETRKLTTSEDDIGLALRTLREVAGSNEATPTARSTASRTLLEFYGYLGTGRTLVPDLERKSNAEMSLSELRRRVAELRKTNGSDQVDPFTPE
jgi:hypothetical protein